jgi:hypothetical protein
MIIWGGYASGGVVNTGGLYDPSADTWTSTSIGANVPTARQLFTTVWTGSKMIVWGGNSNTGGIYNPTADTWLPTATTTDVPVPYTGHSAVWSGTKMIIWGGSVTVCPFVCTTTYYRSGSLYDPASDSWSATSIAIDTPGARYKHTAVWTGSKMIIWGGGNPSGLNSGGVYSP